MISVRDKNIWQENYVQKVAEKFGTIRTYVQRSAGITLIKIFIVTCIFWQYFYTVKLKVSTL